MKYLNQQVKLLSEILQGIKVMPQLIRGLFVKILLLYYYYYILLKEKLL